MPNRLPDSPEEFSHERRYHHRGYAFDVVVPVNPEFGSRRHPDPHLAGSTGGRGGPGHGGPHTITVVIASVLGLASLVIGVIVMLLN